MTNDPQYSSAEAIIPFTSRYLECISLACPANLHPTVSTGHESSAFSGVQVIRHLPINPREHAVKFTWQDGAELCHRVRARPGALYQYILLVTAKDNSEDVVIGLEAGADDYQTKPFERNELRARLRVGRRILALQAGLIQAREDLRFQATH